VLTKDFSNRLAVMMLKMLSDNTFEALRQVLRRGKRTTGLRAWIIRRARSSEAAFILLAVFVGGAAACATVAQATLAHFIQRSIFGLVGAQRLSEASPLAWYQLLMLPIGGMVLAVFSIVTNARRRALVDAVEANALHGGRMSSSDSAVIAGQTIISNGFGASVGLEAAFAQVGSAIASLVGRTLRLRRSDMRTLVGSGAGAAIAAAFGAPLAGAFYAFEIVIGSYTPSMIAPVAAAALAGTAAAQLLGSQPYLIGIVNASPLRLSDYFLYAALGAICAAVGILLMRAVAVVDGWSRRLHLPQGTRPVFGGLLLIPIALVSPQALSSGHGALAADMATSVPLLLVLTVLAAKCIASIVSLGFGFRGGLFFASMFIGALLGHATASLLVIAGFPILEPGQAAIVGMAALTVAVVGGPFTMAMLVLETTHDFALTGVVIAASLVASTIVRETFGYSFSTWRLHLRGETIKSARDIGWTRLMTASRMMRKGFATAPASTSIGEFRRLFPVGAVTHVVLTDATGRFAGMASPAELMAVDLPETGAVSELAELKDAVVLPQADVVTTMRAFENAESDVLAVVNGDGMVLGTVSESYVVRRYASELERTQRELFGE
jgi:CIC family chloride channel protein